MSPTRTRLRLASLAATAILPVARAQTPAPPSLRIVNLGEHAIGDLHYEVRGQLIPLHLSLGNLSPPYDPPAGDSLELFRLIPPPATARQSSRPRRLTMPGFSFYAQKRSKTRRAKNVPYGDHHAAGN